MSDEMELIDILDVGMKSGDIISIAKGVNKLLTKEERRLKTYKKDTEEYKQSLWAIERYKFSIEGLERKAKAVRKQEIQQEIEQIERENRGES